MKEDLESKFVDPDPEQDSRYSYPSARLLDAGGRVLSKGRAYIPRHPTLLLFEPEAPCSLDTLRKNGATLVLNSSLRIEVAPGEICQEPKQHHIHFLRKKNGLLRN